MPYANLNLEGRLVNDPEFKQGKDNHEFCTFRVAVNQWHGDQEQATFFNCTGGHEWPHQEGWHEEGTHGPHHRRSGLARLSDARRSDQNIC